MADTERLVPAHRADRRLPQQARPRRRRRAARPDRRRRALRAAAGPRPQRRADRGPPRQSRLGAPGLGAGPKRRTRSGARAVPGPRSPPHPRHPRRGRGGDGRRLGRGQAEPARRQGGDDHRRLQRRARPDQRDGPGAPGASGRARLTPGRAARQALRPARRRRGDLLRPVPHPPARSGSRTGSPAPSSTPIATRDRVTIETHEREPREVAVDTAKFSDLNLGYAVHVYKAQGITAEASGILTGGWQTDREHAYVALSRAREQTQVYVAREDLGEAGDGHRRDRTARRADAPQRRAGGEHRQGGRRARPWSVRRGSSARSTADQDLDRGFGIE